MKNKIKNQEEETQEINKELIVDTSTRSIYLFSDITSELAVIVIRALKVMSLEDSPITIYINSMGGDVDAMTAIISAMKSTKNEIHTNVMGIAYSAGAMIFLAGDHRSMSSYSTLMFHSMLGIAEDKIVNMVNYADNLILREKILDKYLLKDINISLHEFRKKVEKDWFVTPKEALKLKMVHRVY